MHACKFRLLARLSFAPWDNDTLMRIYERLGRLYFFRLVNSSHANFIHVRVEITNAKCEQVSRRPQVFPRRLRLQERRETKQTRTPLTDRQKSLARTNRAPRGTGRLRSLVCWKTRIKEWFNHLSYILYEIFYSSSSVEFLFQTSGVWRRGLRQIAKTSRTII